MKEFCYQMGDTRIAAHCLTAPTRNGFKHTCELCAIVNDQPYSDVNVVSYYLNRTWEKFEYQSTLLKAIRTLQERITNRNLTEFKHANNYKRMTAKRRVEFEKYQEEPFALNEILKAIKEGKEGYNEISVYLP